MTQGSPFSHPNMENRPASIHSFIIKLWLEETRQEAGRSVWRGHITHVPNGERRYLKDLYEIPAFIMPYLEGIGMKMELCWRVKQWLTRWKRHRMRQN